MGLIDRLNHYASSFLGEGDLFTLDSKWSILWILILVFLLFSFFVLVIKNTQNLLDEFFDNKKIKSFFLSKPKLYSFVRFLITVPHILLLGSRYFILLLAFIFIFFNVDKKPCFIWDINMVILLMSFSLFLIGVNLFMKKNKYGFFGKFSLLMAGLSVWIYIYFIMNKLGFYEFHFQDVNNWYLVIISILSEYFILFSNLFNLSTVANVGEILKIILKIILYRMSPVYRIYSAIKSIYELYFKGIKINVVDNSIISNDNNNSSGNFDREIDEDQNNDDTTVKRLKGNYCWGPSMRFCLPASTEINPSFRSGIDGSDLYWGSKNIGGAEYPLIFYDNITKVPYHHAIMDPNYEEMMHKYKNSLMNNNTSNVSSYMERINITKNRELLLDFYIKVQQQHSNMMKSVVFHKLLELDNNNNHNQIGRFSFVALESFRLNAPSYSHNNLYYHVYDYHVLDKNNHTEINPKFIKEYCYFIKSNSFDCELFLAHCHKLEKLESHLVYNRHYWLSRYLDVNYLPRMNKDTYLQFEESCTKDLKLYSFSDFRNNTHLTYWNKEKYISCVNHSMDIIDECIFNYIDRRNDINLEEIQILRDEYRYLLDCWRRIEIDKANVLFESPNISQRDPLINSKWNLSKNDEWIHQSQMLPMLVKKNPCLIAHIKYPESAVIKELARLHSRFGK